MKALTLITSFFIFVSAQAASTYSTRCTNAESTVKWVDSSATKFIQFTGHETQTLNLNLVEIKFLDKIVLDLKVEKLCGDYRENEVFSSKVEIRHSENTLIETAVICEKKIRTTFLCRN